MNYGIILAGGTGTRMGNAEKPKQYLTIGNKPIIIHTLEKFILCNELDKIIVLCPRVWVDHTKNIIRTYIGENDRVNVIEGGSVRNETIMNALKHIEETDGMDEETIIVTHDAVRPFVTTRIIKDNIEAAKKYGACDTVIPATDTIVESENGSNISAIPDRSKLYQGQTPQSFRAMELKTLYNELSEEEKKVLTDAAKILILKGKPVILVEGETFNIKITYPYDLEVAEVMCRGGK